MSLVLKQVRECDGACCKESPRWPTHHGLTCRYLKGNLCTIKTGEDKLPSKRSPAAPDMTAEECFRIYCMEWPQQHCEEKIGETANCCWQWIDGD